MSLAHKKSHKVNEHSISEQEAEAFSTIDNLAFHFGQSAEDITLLRMFPQQKQGFYVDVGAYHPNRYSNTFLLYHLYGWRGINIDASEDAIPVFDTARPDDKNVVAAIGEGKKKTYYVFEAAARNTLSESNLQRQTDRSDTKRLGERKVKMFPLKKILKENMSSDGSIDLMTIDVEGLEMEVLRTNDWHLYRPSVVLLEDYLIGEGKMRSSDIYRFMNDIGYALASHHFDTSFYIDIHNKRRKLGKIDRAEFMGNLHKLIHEQGGAYWLKAKADKSHEFLKLQNEYMKQKNELRRLREENQNLLNSLSWRTTKPLRRGSSIVRKLKH